MRPEVPGVVPGESLRLAGVSSVVTVRLSHLADIGVHTLR